MDSEISVQLEEIKQIQLKMLEVLNEMLRFWKRYDERYVEEVEQDHLVNLTP